MAPLSHEVYVIVPLLNPRIRGRLTFVVDMVMAKQILHVSTRDAERSGCRSGVTPD